MRRTSETRRRPLARWWRAARLRPSVTASSSRPTTSSSGRETLNGRLIRSALAAGRAARSERVRAPDAVEDAPRAITLVDEPLDDQEQQRESHQQRPELVARRADLGVLARDVRAQRRDARPVAGAMFDSSAENRSTAKSSGSSSVAPAAAPAPGDALGSTVGVGVGVAPGDPDGLGRRNDLGPIDAQLPGVDEGHRRRAGGAGRQLLDRPVGQRDAHAQRVRRHGDLDRRRGRHRVEDLLRSNAQQLAGDVRDHDRPRHLERQVALAKVEGETRPSAGRRADRVEERAVRAGDDRACPAGRSICCVFAM